MEGVEKSIFNSRRNIVRERENRTSMLASYIELFIVCKLYATGLYTEYGMECFYKYGILVYLFWLLLLWNWEWVHWKQFVLVIGIFYLFVFEYGKNEFTFLHRPVTLKQFTSLRLILVVFSNDRICLLMLWQLPLIASLYSSRQNYWYKLIFSQVSIFNVFCPLKQVR